MADSWISRVRSLQTAELAIKESHLRDQVVFVAMKVHRHLRHELGRKSLDMLEVTNFDIALFA
jgi:hypothetical protein